VIYATCGKDGGDTLPLLKKALGDRGVTVAGEFVFDRAGMKDPEKINAMIAKIQSAGV